MSLDDLTPREREVALLIRDGLQDKEIAHRLSIAVETAEAHVKRVREAYGGVRRSRVAAMVAAEVGI